MNDLSLLFSQTFMIRAMVAGGLITLCAALLGIVLVLKRYAMIGDGLSHVGFGALAVASVMNLAPLAVAIPVVILAAFALIALSRNTKIKGDAMVGVISSGALAIGVMAISMTKGMNIDINSYMFGSIISLTKGDVVCSVILCVCVLAVFVLLFPRLFSVTFDDAFARATGTNATLYNGVLAVLTAVTVVLGMRMMGALLISSLIVFPALSSMRICNSRFLTVVILAAVISLVCFFAGIILSFFWGCPTSATVVCMNLIVFVFSFLFGKLVNCYKKRA